MQINWKVRIRNPLFWVEVFLAVLLPVLAYLGIALDELTSWSILGTTLFEAVKNPYVLGMVLVSVWNAINDPTTQGLSDSEQVMSYTVPKARK